MKRRHSEEIKTEVLEAYSKGVPVSKIFEKSKIPKSTIYYWIKMNRKLKLRNGSEISIRQYYMLQLSVERIAKENSILHECGCSSNSPNKVKLEVISKLDGKYTIHALCRALKIRRSTYYHYKLRRPSQTEIEKRDLVLKPVLKELFELTKGRIGSEKLAHLMEKKGYSTSPKRIRRLLDEMNLVCRSRKKQMHYNFSKSSKSRRDLVKRDFCPPAPNKIWVSDITYVRVNYKAYYICVILDLYSRKVVGFNVANNQDTNFVTETFKKAYIQRGPDKGLIFHTDQGGQVRQEVA